MMNNLEFKVERINRLTMAGSTKAFVDLNINDVLLIKGLRIVEAKGGLFVSMPMEKGKNNRWYENVRCLKNDIRNVIHQTVMEAYQNPEV